ncbi:MAG: hypothetical protein KGO94_11995 [Alphaproteobacteria bacterium]|nr:hypothetical protein [Alphaproteobacteria bacterium]
MRLISVLCVVAASLLAASPVHAYENFIPLGTGYSTGVSDLPPPDSAAQALISQTDIYETEEYRRLMELHKFRNSLNQAGSNVNAAGPSDFIDY